MNIRLYNARILTMEENCSIFFGEVWVKNEQIIYVAKQEEMNEVYNQEFPIPKWDREIDCHGNLLMPGFKNAHTHSPMTLMRSLADGLPLQEWLETMIFPLEAKLTGDDIYHFTKLAILEYLSSGITGIFDMYLDPDNVAKACIDMGMRCVIVSGLNNFAFSVKEIEEYYLKWNLQNPLISYRLGCHAEYTCDKSLLEDLSQLSHKYNAPIYAHMSETEKEVQECIGRYGMAPPVFFESLGLFDFGGAIFHGVHVSDEDLEVFKRRGIAVVTNPASNGKLASGMAPIKDYLEKKITVAIGTDGASSNNSLDMFKEMFLALVFTNLREKDASCVTAENILRMATVGGAHVMGISDSDILACGKKADIIMLDLEQPNMHPFHNIVNNIVYSGSKSNIKMTMIHGKILYENGEYFVGEEIQAIYKQCKLIAERLVAK